MTLAHRTDLLQTNAGLREYEAEIGLPLWHTDVRRTAQRQVDSDTVLLGRQNDLARLKLAGEVRELVGQAAMLQAERDLAARKGQEASQLAADTERRVRAGDVPRVDLLMAQSAWRQAEVGVTQAEANLARVKLQWQALTGLNAMPQLNEEPGNATAHPSLLASLSAVASAQARMAAVEADRRDPMELGIGISGGQASVGVAGETSVRFTLRIPLGSAARNTAKLAAARAELDAAQADADAAGRQVAADQAVARAHLNASRRSESLAMQRAALAHQVQSLVAKAHALGEADLPTRMRADNDKHDADLSLARARIETQRAIAQLNQSLGLLP